MIDLDVLTNGITDANCELRDAIDAANTDTAVDGRPAGAGDDVMADRAFYVERLE